MQPALEGEPAGDEAHDERAGGVDEHRAPREVEAAIAAAGDIDAMPQRPAEPGAEENEDVGFHGV